MQSYKIKIYLSSFSILSLNLFLQKLSFIFLLNSHIIKKNKNILTLLKSPHVHKKARVQYQFKFYKTFILFKTYNFINFLYLLKILQKFNIQNINIDKLKIIK